MQDVVYSPTPKLYESAVKLKVIIYVAWALTPKYPVIKVINSYAHHSEHAITVYGIPIFKYSVNPIKDLLSGKKTAYFISY